VKSIVQDENERDMNIYQDILIYKRERGEGVVMSRQVVSMPIHV